MHSLGRLVGHNQYQIIILLVLRRTPSDIALHSPLIIKFIPEDKAWKKGFVLEQTSFDKILLPAF